MQALGDALPGSEYACVEQCTHVVSDVAPTTLEKVPRAQGIQVSEPAIYLNVPAGQATHV